MDNTQTALDAEDLAYIAKFEAELKGANTLEALFAIESDYSALHSEDIGRLWVDRALNDIGLSVTEQMKVYCSFETCLQQYETARENPDEGTRSLMVLSQYVFDTLLSRVTTVGEYVELLLCCELAEPRYLSLLEKVLTLELGYDHICEIMEEPEQNMLRDRNARDIMRRLFALLDEKEF